MASASVREKIEAYFSVLNSTAGRMMADLDAVKQSHGCGWNDLSYLEQSNELWRSLVRPEVEDKYGLYPTSRPEEEYFPVLRINSGEKIIVDDDSSAGKLFGCSWRDEHSAPFSWETQSQLDLQLIEENEETQESKVTSEASSSQMKEKGESEEEDEVDDKEEEEGSSSSTEMLPPAVACAVASPHIIHSPLPEIKKEERRAATLPSCHSHQMKYGHNSGVVKGRREVNPEDDLSIKVDLHNPAHMTIPKTGFDFLDNW